MRTRIIMALLATLFVAALAAPAVRADEMSDLKKRFETRYPVLNTLKGAGKAGETYLGFVEAVKAEYLSETVELEGKKITVSEFLQAENADRTALYAALAKQAGTTPEKVAERNAKRNFEKAGAEEYLKTKDGWVQKKDMKE